MGATLRWLLVLLITAGRPLLAAVPDDIANGLTRAVARGDRSAQLAQAELIVSGEIAGDPRTARGALEKAAEDGHGGAAYTLGVLAYQDAPQDLAGALRWWRIAARAGHDEAQYNLGLLLGASDQHTTQADAALEAAAAQHHVLACFALGTRLATRAANAAQAWLQCAAKQGYGPAQFNLATLLARAARNDEELAVARRWYAAAALTFAPAASALAALPAQLPTAQTPVPVPAALLIRDDAWVMAQAQSAYTVQVASGASAEVLLTLLQSQLRAADVACVRERPASRQPFSAIVGSYPDRDSAKHALAQLPASLRANQPWVRRFSSLQQALRQAANSAQDGANDARAVSN